MQEFSGLTDTTSEQHQELTEAKMKRDHSDLEKIKEKLSTVCMPSLRNIITGLVAKEDVYVHEFETVGNEIIDKMVGKPVFGISFKRKDQATTLTDESTINFGQGQIIDPALLFQRFLVMEDLMSCELSPFPTALFKAKEIFHKADKAPTSTCSC
ncbi:hypothetical protein Pcinc_034617 [Petrolisthes cinctipes]|uniref:Uncharacterized protein n=1 Tax=Petrolisthes cinctipes TaxID=88211 RepID=A0AAE1BZN7_PETCI|nr:hypothetical protein Pcinc_034617 [Petrolisthes cinctipes]